MDSLSPFFVSSLLHGVDTPQALATIAAWPIHIASAAGGTIAAGINWGYASAAVVTWLLTTAATWLVSARMTSAVLREQNRQLKAGMKDLLTDVRALRGQVHGLSDGLHDAEERRTQCELRAVKTFASREELTRLLVEVSAGTRDLAGRMDGLAESFRGSVGKVHGRVDDLQERLASLEGKTSIAPRVPVELGEQADA